MDSEKINKVFDNLLDNSVLSGLSSHYVNEKENKLYLSFDHVSHLPSARVKTIMESVGVKQCNYMRVSNTGETEIASGKVSIDNKIKVNFKQGVFRKQQLNWDLKTFVPIQGNEKNSFTEAKGIINSILDKTRQVEKTLFHNPDVVAKLDDFNKMKLNHFVNDYPKQIPLENINGLKEATKDFQVLNDKVAIMQINQNNFKNLNNMVVLGYKPSEGLINQISSSTTIDEGKKVAVMASLKKEASKELYKSDEIKSTNSQEKSITKDKNNGLNI
ncbi:MAG: hypothetical protein HS119_11310 [Flavobacteriales bacterium]|nr:hypothetical protein [Flavobacteriales bacterium]